VIFLLDGLDEVHVNKQNEILYSIISFINWKDPKKKCRILLTCREQNFDFLNDKGILLREDFIEYNISELCEHEIEKMVFNRHKNFKEKNKNPEHFIQEIRSNSSILDLHRIPFLLTVSIALYLNRNKQIVPHKIEDFYNEIINLYILRRDSFINENNKLRVQEKISIIQRFALDQLILATENNYDFESFEITKMIDAVNKFADESLNFSSNQAKNIINDFYIKDGLIKKLGEEQLFTFAHRSFHEFLAAKQLYKLGKKGFRILISNLQYTSWHQVTIYYSCIHDNIYAPKIIDTLINMADISNQEVDKFMFFDLLSKCLAVFDKSFISIYQKALDIIKNNIQTAQQDCRNDLLIKLLIIGRNTPVQISKQIEDTFQQYFDFENPQIMAKEISRLNPTFYLPLYTLMVNSDSEKQIRAALIGLSEIESIEKINLLWQLVDYFEQKNDSLSSAETRRQLFIMIEHHKDAVKRLNQLGSRLSHVSKDSISSAYPFIESNQPNNFSKLLALEKINTKSIEYNEKTSNLSPWKRFFYTILKQKSSVEESAWQRLPKDRLKKIRSVQWQTIGRLLMLIGVIASMETILLLACTLFSDTNIFSDKKISFIAYINLFSLITIICLTNRYMLIALIASMGTLLLFMYYQTFPRYLGTTS